MVEAPAEPSSAGSRTSPPLWVVVLAACAGQFLVVLDVAVVNIALPSMRDGLGMSSIGLQWVVNAYTLTFAGFMLLGGRAGDIFGRKRTFLLGLALFTLASLAGGLAQESWQLVAARAVQGVGAAVLAPSTLAVLTVSVPEGPARIRAIGTWSATGALGGATGGLIGGLLTDLLSWRWVLLINVPVGGLVLAAAAIWLVESRDGAGRRLDVPGALLVTAGVSALAYGIVQTESSGWGAAETLVPLFGGLLLLAVFVLVEARARQPLMPLKLFRLRTVSAANTAMFVVGSAMVSSWYFLTLYLQNVLGYPPLEAGFAFIPHSIGALSGSKLAPLVIARIGVRRTGILGVCLTAAACLWQGLVLAPGGDYLASVGAPGLVMMYGVGMTATALASIATSGAPPGDSGLASGLVNTARTMGGSIGLAVLSTLAASRSEGSDTPAGLASGYSLVFLTSAVVLLLSGLLMLVALPRGSRR